MVPPRRVAIVAGAANGIARAIALRLADDGIDIAVCDWDSSKAQGVVTEIEKKGRRALAVEVDVGSERQVASMVNIVVSALGGLDIMVAFASKHGFESTEDLAEEFSTTDLDEFQAIMHSNAGIVFMCYKYAAEQMVSQGRGGRIIGVSSTADMPASSRVAYTASKFAIRGLTHATAAGLAKHGITVNAYAPGAIDTPIAREAAKDIQDAFEVMANVIPAGDVEALDNAARLVAYLVSDKASSLTGHTISMKGGTLFI